MLALIVARGGSKRLPRKCLKLFNGLPLICWTIIAAQKSKVFDDIIVSTDDLEIAEIAKSFGAVVPFIRPDELAGDKTEMLDVVLHAIKFLKFSGQIALLQPTSPLRQDWHIIEACQLFDQGASSVVSFTNVAPNLNWLYSQQPGVLDLKPIGSYFNANEFGFVDNVRSILIPNGAIYMLNSENLKSSGKFITEKTTPYIMDKDHSIDIDTQSDWDLADLIFKGKKYNE